MAGLDKHHPSYHDLYITTAEIERTSIVNLSYGLEVTCTRAGGWRLWSVNEKDGRSRPIGNPRLVAGEYDEPPQWLRLDVDGHVIVDSSIRERA